MFIGIDLGTSSVKMILVDREQNILATSDSPLTVKNPIKWLDLKEVYGNHVS